jgi:hypothetical protein
MNTGVLSVNTFLDVTELYLTLDLRFAGFGFLRIEKKGTRGLVLEVLVTEDVEGAFANFSSSFYF